MKLSIIKRWIVSGNFFYDYKFSIILWFGLAIFASFQIFFMHTGINNYFIYKNVFLHLIHQQNLYAEYPQEYFDVNLYGPVFSLVIAPFTFLPDYSGAMLWALFNTCFLYFAISQLPLQAIWRNAIVIFCSVEMMNNVSWYQINPSIAACIILGFAYTTKGKEIWALFFILLAGFIKIYGIAGFAFFFFSKNKWNYTGWAIAWCVIFFCLPMLITNPAFVIQSYNDWAGALIHKNSLNVDVKTVAQDISVMGMIKRIFHIPNLNTLLVLLPALLLFGTQYLPVKYYKDIRYQLYLLCSVLIFTVIFSTGSEGPTYIIALPAICTWFLMQPSSKWVFAVFIFATLIANFGYSDLLTPWFRKNIMAPFALRALPCFIIWLILVYQILTKQFLRVDMNRLRV